MDNIKSVKLARPPAADSGSGQDSSAVNQKSKRPPQPDFSNSRGATIGGNLEQRHISVIQSGVLDDVHAAFIEPETGSTHKPLAGRRIRKAAVPWHQDHVAIDMEPEHPTGTSQNQNDMEEVHTAGGSEQPEDITGKRDEISIDIEGLLASELENKKSKLASSLITGRNFNEIEEQITQIRGGLRSLLGQSDMYTSNLKLQGMLRPEFYRSFGNNPASAGLHSQIRFIPAESRPGHHDNIAGFLRVQDDLGDNLTRSATYPVVSFRVGEDEYLYLRGYSGRLLSIDDFQLLISIPPQDRTMATLDHLNSGRNSTFAASLQEKYKMNLHTRNLVMGLSHQADFYEAKHAMLPAPIIRPVDARAPSLKPFTGGANLWWGDYEMNTYSVPGTTRTEKRVNLKDHEEDPTLGFPKIYLVYYKAENKFIVYLGENHSAKGPAPGGREPARFISGPVLSTIYGVKRLELLGPEYAPGSRPGAVGQVKRVWKRIARLPIPDIRENIRPGEPVEVMLTCQDGSRHKLKVSEGKLMMNLENPEMGAKFFRKNTQGSEVLNKSKLFSDFVDICTYSYMGDHTGVFTSASGRKEPRLVTDSQEKLPVAPLITPVPGSWAGCFEILQHLAREAASIGNSKMFGESFPARLVLNPGLNAVVKTACIMLSQEIVNRSITTGVARIGAFGSALPTVATIANPQFWGGILTIVVVQTCADKIVRKLIKPAIPKEWLSDNNKCTREIMPALGNWLLEFSRLLTNYGILSATGFRKHPIELPVNAVQAGAYALIQHLRESVGDRKSHPVEHWLFDMMQYVNDLACRSLGNTLAYQISSPSSAIVAGSGSASGSASSPGIEYTERLDFASSYQQAIFERLLVRAGDKMVMPTVAQVVEGSKFADYKGPVEGQYRRIYKDRIGSADRLSSVSVLADKWAYEHTPDLFKHLWFQKPDYGAGINRWWLTFREKLAAGRDGLLSASDRRMLELMNQYSSLRDEEQNSFMERHQAEIQGIIGDISYTREELDAEQREFYMRNTEMLTSRDSEEATRSDTTRSRPFDKGPSLTHMYKEKAFRSLAERESKIHTKDTTFSSRHQIKVMELQQKMRSISTIRDDIHRNFPGTVNRRFRKDLERAISSYTVESGYFHLPLRYPHTGQARWIEPVRGIKVPYNVLNLPSNTTDEFTQQYDPIGTVLINLALRNANKFPFPLFRGVHSVAGYKPDNNAGWPETGKRDWRDTDVKTGDIVMNTEMLSTTASDTMARNFSMSIDAGMTDLRRRLKFVFDGRTAVNITQLTDLNQAEALYPPGAQFRISSVAGTFGDLGLVVRAEQVNTYEEWELGRNMDEIQMDAKTGKLTKSGAHFSPRNYFLGRFTTQNEQAQHGSFLWFRPFDASNTPRGVKDAIHASFLRDDHIVKRDPNDNMGRSYLDLGTENIHHEYYRGKAIERATEAIKGFKPGFKWENLASLEEEEIKKLPDFEMQVVNNEKSREQEIRSVHSSADQIAALLNYDSITAGKWDVNTVLGDKEERFVIWLAANVLRREIKLVDLSAREAEVVYSVSRAYDRANLKETHRGTPQTPFVVGVLRQDQSGFAKGYYSIASDSTGNMPSFKWFRMSGTTEGLTLGNLLHAVYVSRLAGTNDYSVSAEKRAIMPRPGATETVSQLVELLKRFSKFNFLPFQREMINEYDRLYGVAQADIEEAPSDEQQLLRVEAGVSHGDTGNKGDGRNLNSFPKRGSKHAQVQLNEALYGGLSKDGKDLYDEYKDQLRITIGHDDLTQCLHAENKGLKPEEIEVIVSMLRRYVEINTN